MATHNYLDKTGLASVWQKVKDNFASVTKSISNGTISSGATRVLIGDEYKTEIKPDDGYYISSVTVTVGGVDVTSQVFDGVNIGDLPDTYVTASEVSAMIDAALAEYENGDVATYG